MLMFLTLDLNILTKMLIYCEYMFVHWKIQLPLFASTQDGG